MSMKLLRSLVPRNMIHYKLETIQNEQSFVVAMEVKDEKCNRVFIEFEGFPQFYQVYLKFPKNERHFHEVMRSDSRKLYFDIDSNSSPELVGECIIQLIQSIRDEVIEKTGNSNFITTNEVIVLSSCDATKQSYHIVVPHYVCNRLIDLKKFVSNVLSRMDDCNKSMIDPQVYRKNQNFRMLGCSKLGSSRILTQINKIDPYFDNDPIRIRNDRLYEARNLEMLTISYVSGYYPENKIIKYDITEKVDSPGKVSYETDLNFAVPDGLEFDKVVEYDTKKIYLYLNKKGYFCPNCNRNHENENPYVSYDKLKKVPYFQCRRQ